MQQKALQFYADGGHWDYNDTMTKETYLNDKGEKAAEALAIKPEDVELVEVGGFVMHEDKIGTRYPSSQMSYNYDEFEIGALNKLYTIKQKG